MANNFYFNYSYKRDTHAFAYNFLSKDQCEFIVDYCKNNFIHLETDASVYKEDNTSEYDSGTRESKIIFIPYECKALEWLFLEIESIVKKINDEFFQFDIDSIEELQFTKYDSNKKSFYGKHTDMLLHKPVFRKLSFTLQLTDPTQYEGGDVLLHIGNEPAFACREQGSITFFPSFTLHEVTPVVQGIRHSLVGWCGGRPFR